MKILKLFVLAVMLAVPAMASAANPLPEGFIALPESRMNWADAKAFCEQQGGRLPRINNSDSWDGRSEYTMNGFGVRGALWPSGLPSGSYWAGTENTDRPGRSWIVNDLDGKAFVLDSYQDSVDGVVCVP